MIVDVDIFTSNNTSSDGIIDSVDEDAGETDSILLSSASVQLPESSTSSYKGRYHYNRNTSDGAVLGPFTGT